MTRWLFVTIVSLAFTACEISESETTVADDELGVMDRGSAPPDGAASRDGAPTTMEPLDADDGAPARDMTPGPEARVDGALPRDATPPADMGAPMVDATPLLEDATPAVMDAVPVVMDADPAVMDAAPAVMDAAPAVMDAAPVVMDAAPVIEPLVIGDLEAMEIDGVPGFDVGFRCKAYLVCSAGQNCIYFQEKLGYYSSSEGFVDGDVVEPPAPARFEIARGPAGQCGDPPVVIEAAQTLRLTHDGGQSIDVFLPAFEGPHLRLYIASSGATYTDAQLTRLAQAAP